MGPAARAGARGRGIRVRPGGAGGQRPRQRRRPPFLVGEAREQLLQPGRAAHAPSSSRVISNFSSRAIMISTCAPSRPRICRSGRRSVMCTHKTAPAAATTQAPAPQPCPREREGTQARCARRVAGACAALTVSRESAPRSTNLLSAWTCRGVRAGARRVRVGAASAPSSAKSARRRPGQPGAWFLGACHTHGADGLRAATAARRWAAQIRLAVAAYASLICAATAGRCCGGRRCWAHQPAPGMARGAPCPAQCPAARR